MLHRLRAIAVLALLLTAGAARADDLSKLFIPASPPHALANIAFIDQKGMEMSLRDFHGRYLLVNLWATWCAPCRQELPSLDALQNQFVLNRFSVLAIAEDTQGLSAAQGFYSRHGIRHLPLYADPSGRAPALLNADGLPTTILIDPDGNEIGRVNGEADWSNLAAVKFLEGKMGGYPK